MTVDEWGFKGVSASSEQAFNLDSLNNGGKFRGGHVVQFGTTSVFVEARGLLESQCRPEEFCPAEHAGSGWPRGPSGSGSSLELAAECAVLGPEHQAHVGCVVLRLNVGGASVQLCCSPPVGVIRSQT